MRLTNNPIFNRYSVRDFSNKEIEKEKIDKILEAAMQAPSANNQNIWEFLVITEKNSKYKISKMSNYSRAAYNASIVLIILANTNLLTKNNTKWWPLDMAACTENILLQCTYEDLGAVWLGIYPKTDRVSYIQEIFNLPKEIIPFSAVALGYEVKKISATKKFKPERIHYNIY